MFDGETDRILNSVNRTDHSEIGMNSVSDRVEKLDAIDCVDSRSKSK